MSKRAQLEAEYQRLVEEQQGQIDALLRTAEAWKIIHTQDEAIQDAILDRWHWQVMARGEN